MERANQNSNAEGRGGNRPLSGRQLDPIRKNFEVIKTPENMGKSPQQQQLLCKKCMTKVSARPERLRAHVQKCSPAEFHVC